MKEIQSKRKNKEAFFTTLFAILMSVCGFLSIPLPGGVPIVTQNMIPILAGALLGGIQGIGATGLFLVAGSLGLPVFSSGRGGITHLSGPTGGFLMGYFIASLITGMFIGKPETETKTLNFKIIIGCTVGFIFIYIPGIMQFMQVTESDFTHALTVCVTPFLLWDAIKLVVTIILAIFLRPIIARYFESK